VAPAARPHRPIWSTTIADPTASTRRGAATRPHPTAPDRTRPHPTSNRLHPDGLTDDLRGALTRRSTLLREHQRANDSHHAANWMRSHERSVADAYSPNQGPAPINAASNREVSVARHGDRGPGSGTSAERDMSR
jgi:hypothetical protein